MTENVNSPFPTQKPAPILVRRWRTIVDVHGTRYALGAFENPVVRNCMEFEDSLLGRLRHLSNVTPVI